MAYSSQFHMPGAYHFEANPSSGSGLNAGIFRPPMSPSASSSVLNLAKSTGSLCSDASMANNNTPSNVKRKRNRDDPRRESTPLAADWTAADLSATSYDLATPGVGDVATPLLEDRTGELRARRYVLAGQIETPGARTLNPLETNMDDSVYSDVDYRRALGSKKSHEEPQTPANRVAGIDLDATPQTPRSQGWGSFAFTVVGKVWDFCKGGAFRGFYAGGGKGYEWKGGDSTPPTSAGGEDPWGNGSDLPVGLNTPGAFPGANYAPTPEYRDLSPPESTPRPAAKRRQISENGDELRKNWVMVSEEAESQQQHQKPIVSRTEKKRPSLAPQPSNRPSSRQQQSRPQGPIRRISIPVSRLGGTPASNRRASSRISHAGSPALTAREPASFAPSRSPAASPSRRTFSPAAGTSRIPMPGSTSANPFAPPRAASPASRPSSRQSSMPSPSFATPTSGNGHRRAASTAGARGRTGGGDVAEVVSNSPRLDAEAQRLAARKRAAERNTDARMDAFSARLRDMIRQGKEALGTTVEVDGIEDGGDEGWLDDE